MKYWPSTLPRVAEFEPGSGRCSLTDGLTVNGSPELKGLPPRIETAARGLGLDRQGGGGRVCQLHSATPENSSGDKLTQPGAYVLEIDTDRVTITAADEAGWFYGLQSLKQLSLGHEHEGGPACGVIRDAPRFPWRGSMIDSARHFQPVEWILRHLDRMAALKLNRFHWHLTDDEAWRPEIRRYPQLTDEAAWRGTGEHRYGGFYSHEDMRRVVAYARDRFITVIPEIEMPGHCNAVLVAFPELSCDGAPLPLADAGWDAFTRLAGRRAFCAANKGAYALIEHVLEELAEVFEPPYLHIGGDETPRAHWDQCPKCSALLSRINGTGGSDLRVHFLERVANYCRDELDLPTIAWTDGVSDQLPRDQIVNAWFPGESARAARLGYQTINSNHEWTYLDYPDSIENGASKPDWMIVLPLEKLYHFDPMPEGLEPEFADRVLGSETALWTEHAPDAEALERQLMPRLAAFAEALWSPRVGRSYDDFLRRLAQQQHSLDLLAATESERGATPATAPVAL